MTLEDVGTWFLVPPVIGAAVLLAGFLIIQDRWRWMSFWSRIGLVTAMTVLPLAGFSASLYYEFPGNTYAVATYVEHIGVVQHPNGLFAWEFDSRVFHAPTIGAVSIRAGVTPITDNPKVRHVSYWVAARISSPDRFFLEPNRRLIYAWNHNGSYDLVWVGAKPVAVSDVIAQLVGSKLYEFNDQHSRELAAFYNPLDPTQLRDLKKLMEPWLADHLAGTGIAVQVTGFSIE